MYETDEVDIRSKENVRDNGEVFTPFVIVDKMVALIPDAAWDDPEYCFLEPACGNGQFLVRIFERRISSGLSIEDALNTMIGMDITHQNILDCHFRLYERACYQMMVEGMSPQSRAWFSRGIRIIAIVINNIFRVDDSLDYINSGKLAKRKFFFADPTGSSDVLSVADQKKRLDKIKEQVVKYKKSGKRNGVFAPFFKKETK